MNPQKADKPQEQNNVKSRRRILATRIVIGLVAVAAIFIAALFVFSGAIVGPAPAPLQLAQMSAPVLNAPAASADGKWVTEAGSLAGVRVNESFLVQSGTIVGRTDAITGSLVISNNEVSAGSFQVDLTKLTIGGKPNTSLQQLLNTADNPDATLTLTSPIVLNGIQANGQTVSSTATGSLTFHGVSREVTFNIFGRYDGSRLEAAGSAAIHASGWNVSSPFGIHDDDVVEFSVVLGRG